MAERRTAPSNRGAPGRPRMEELLADRRVVLCLGSGGVGKTTTSAALALALAKNGERVVVLTIDPARRLADALGLGGALGNEPVQLSLPKKGRKADRITGEVWAAMLDPAETFEQIIRAESETTEQADRVLGNRLFQNLTSSLSGTNEYMAAERLHQLHRDSRFDRVIVDTPPSRHAIDFLDSPGRLTRFVDHRLYRSVFAPKTSILRPLNAGSQIVMRLLGRLVGGSLVKDVVSFFSDFEGMDRGFRRRAVEIESVLAGPETAYVLVAAPREDRRAEAMWIAGNLEQRGRALAAVIINRSVPVDPEAGAAALEALDGPLADNLRDLLTLAVQEAAVVARLQDGLQPKPAGSHQQEPEQSDDSAAGTEPVPTLRVAEQPEPIKDLQDLLELARLL